MPSESQYARRLAESGCRVIVPTLINRTEPHRAISPIANGFIALHSSLAAGSWATKCKKFWLASIGSATNRCDAAKIGVIGWGEGGLMALYAGALDPRIDAVCVSGYFDNRNDIWQEPIDRNVFGLLEQFGDAELASMIAPRALVVEAARGPEATIPGGRGAPARVVTPELAAVRSEVDRANESGRRLTTGANIATDRQRRGWPRSIRQRARRLSALLKALDPDAKLAASAGSVRGWHDSPTQPPAMRGKCTSLIATANGCCAKANTCAKRTFGTN